MCRYELLIPLYDFYKWQRKIINLPAILGKDVRFILWEYCCWMWTKITRYRKSRRLISVPVRPASEPVVVRQTLDRTQCSNCNILYKWRIKVKQGKENVTSSTFSLLFLSSYPIEKKPFRNTFYGACINSIDSCKQFGEGDSTAICKQLQPKEIWGIGSFCNTIKKAWLVSRPHQNTKTSIRLRKGQRIWLFFPKHTWASKPIPKFLESRIDMQRMLLFKIMARSGVPTWRPISSATGLVPSMWSKREDFNCRLQQKSMSMDT